MALQGTSHVSPTSPYLPVTQKSEEEGSFPSNILKKISEVWNRFLSFLRETFYTCAGGLISYLPSWCFRHIYPSMELAVPVEEVRKTYFALGPNKWKECVDGCHATHGRLVYDRGLHGGTVEPGYIGSMEKAFEFVGETLSTRVTPGWYLQLHRIACAHFEGQKTGTLMGQEKVGVFRDRDDCVSCSYAGSNAMTPEGIAAFEAAELGKLEVLDANGGRKITYTPLSRDQVRDRLQKAIDTFYAEIGSATTSDDKLKAIARFHQGCDWLHPMRDGSTRTGVAALNKVLTEFGFHPVLLEFPNRVTGTNVEQWTDELKKGLALWEMERRKVLV